MPSDKITLGVDGDGSVHHFSRIADRVVVCDSAGAIEQIVDLSDDSRNLSGWVAFVAERRGWDDLNYADSFGDILSEALQA